ncbi:MAG: hypothetical protein AAB719_01130 [Patescibacteria group bacterium]
MRKYLSELYKKPDHHKNRFALLVSGAVTLFIFGIWSLTLFGNDGSQVADANLSNNANEEVSPFESVRINLGTSLQAFKNSFNDIKNNLNTIDFESEYEEMRDGALNTYEQ